MNQNITLSFLSLLVVGCFPFVSPTNLCSTSGLCCKHRDSECVAQRVYPNHTVDTSQLPCYCDHACIELGDCCPDYRQFCGGKPVGTKINGQTVKTSTLKMFYF